MEISSAFLDEYKKLGEMYALKNIIEGKSNTVEDTIGQFTKFMSSVFDSQEAVDANKSIGNFIRETTDLYKNRGMVDGNEVVANRETLSKKIETFNNTFTKEISNSNNVLASSLGLTASVLKSMDQAADAAISGNKSSAMGNFKVSQEKPKERTL